MDWRHSKVTRSTCACKPARGSGGLQDGLVSRTNGQQPDGRRTSNDQLMLIRWVRRPVRRRHGLCGLSDRGARSLIRRRWSAQKRLTVATAWRVAEACARAESVRVSIPCQGQSGAQGTPRRRGRRERGGGHPRCLGNLSRQGPAYASEPCASFRSNRAAYLVTYSHWQQGRRARCSTDLRGRARCSGPRQQ